MPSFFKLIITSILVSFFVIADDPAVYANDRSASSSISTGYSALKLFLEDEEHLTTIRRTKMVITFSGISNGSSKLIDEIASTSEQALEELEQLTSIKPRINLIEFSDDLVAKATFDSLRMTAGKEFLLVEAEDFEKNLLVSQLKVLRVISHLALALEEKETSNIRKKWLRKLALRYESYYQKVNARISLSRGKSTH
jgi:hypothetical protein